MLSEHHWVVKRAQLYKYNGLLHKLRSEKAKKSQGCAIVECEEPDISDRLLLASVRRKLSILKRESLESNMTTITRGICDDVTIWSKLCLVSLRSDYLMCLSGFLFATNDRPAMKSALVTGEMPFGCNLKSCADNNHGDLVLHRIYSCSRYATERNKLIGKLNYGSALNKEMIKKVMVDSKKAHTLMEFIHTIVKYEAK